MDRSDFCKLLRAEICSCGRAVLRLSPFARKAGGPRTVRFEPRSERLGPCFHGKQGFQLKGARNGKLERRNLLFGAQPFSQAQQTFKRSVSASAR